jgi:hypothetical protein
MLESNVVWRLIVDDNILKLESRSSIVVPSSSDLDESLIVLLEFNVAETGISAVDAEEAVVTRDRGPVSDENDSDV